MGKPKEKKRLLYVCVTLKSIGTSAMCFQKIVLNVIEFRIALRFCYILPHIRDPKPIATIL